MWINILKCLTLVEKIKWRHGQLFVMQWGRDFQYGGSGQKLENGRAGGGKNRFRGLVWDGRQKF